MTTLTTPPLANRPATAADRVTGYDLARSWAIFGMVAVHALLVLAVDGATDRGVPAAVLRRLDGRAAALFMVLAGVGVSLRAHHPSDSPEQRADRLSRARRTLLKRGLFLLVVGFANLVLWPGDILRVYGVSLALAAALLTVRDRTLGLVVIGFAAAFIALMGVMDYGRHWDWGTLEYHDLWTPAGLARNLFYDGFRSVFPWSGLLIFGMWLGRRDVRRPQVRRRMLGWGVATAVTAEALSAALIAVWTRHPHGASIEDIAAVAGTESMPPLPLFLLAAGGTAAAAIGLALLLAAGRGGGTLVVRAMTAAGQMAFTWYVVHILVIAALFEAGATQRLTFAGAIFAASAFFAVVLTASALWKKRFRQGPLEGLMRKVCG